MKSVIQFQHTKLLFKTNTIADHYFWRAEKYYGQCFSARQSYDPYPHLLITIKTNIGAQGRNRTADTGIFKRGLIAPDRFIPIAEDTGLIHEIGDWVFKQAVDFVRLWREQSQQVVQVSINISPRQFMNRNVISQWLQMIKQANIPTSAIVIEITEGLLLDDQLLTQNMLKKIRDAGMQIALDDFGTGYSALAYLKKFHIDYLKIDQSFVRDMCTDQNDRAIAETIALMAKRLGITTIAEGVESQEQQNMLSNVNCEYMQGYLYSPPIKQDDFFAQFL